MVNRIWQAIGRYAITVVTGFAYGCCGGLLLFVIGPILGRLPGVGMLLGWIEKPAAYLLRNYDMPSMGEAGLLILPLLVMILEGGVIGIVYGIVAATVRGIKGAHPLVLR